MDRSFEERLAKLKQLLEIQMQDGTWNYDEYNLGMANGMILAIAVMENTFDPDYLTAPDLFIYYEEILDKLSKPSIIVNKTGG